MVGCEAKTKYDQGKYANGSHGKKNLLINAKDGAPLIHGRGSIASCFQINLTGLFVFIRVGNLNRENDGTVKIRKYLKLKHQRDKVSFINFSE
jgi:hypothetical protein